MKRNGLTDLHQHVLYGVDDGPKTPEKMHAMIAEDVREGIGLVCATAHANALLRPGGLARYMQRLAEANAYCESEGLTLRFVQGCEIRYFDSAPDLLLSGALPTLGNSRYVLIEFGHDITAEQIGKAADSLYGAGFFPILAHVERYGCLVRRPKRAIRLKEKYGLCYQINCESITDPHGFLERHFVRRMLKAEAVDAIATDAHDPAARPVRMRKAYQAVAAAYGKPYAKRLVTFAGKIAGKEK